MLLEPFENISLISDVLCDIVAEFFLNEQIVFNIFVMKSMPVFAMDILNEFLVKSKGKFGNRLIFAYENREKSALVLRFSRSAILFLRSLSDFEDIERYFMFERYHDQPVKFIIFVPNLTYKALSQSWIVHSYKKLTVFTESVLQYGFFITNELKTITFSTFEWFSENQCNNAFLSKLNVFDKKSRMWTKKLINYEKFLQYHGCELVFMLPAPFQRKIIYHVSGYSMINKNQTDFKVFGISPIIFEIVSKIHNYTVGYQPAKVSHEWMEFVSPVFFIPINGTFKHPQVYFEVITSNTIGKDLRRSNTFVDLKYRIYSTPAEAYTPFEKLFLPFDLETWILLVITFALTFISIFILNFMSKSTRSLVYGNRVETPIWNAISIFFGISQTRLPNNNFSRFILILFVYFCLIFRTCFQSKFFEFLTSEPRRPPPKTLEDLIDREYVLHVPYNLTFHSNIFDEKGRRPEIKIISLEQFDDIFKMQSQNDSAKIALFVDEFFQNNFEGRNQRNHDWNQLDFTSYVSHESFAFLQFSFYLRMYKRIIDIFIDTGIMKKLCENYYTVQRKFEKIIVGPKILTLQDMLIGFKLWLGSCCLSLFAFVIEHLIRIITISISKQKMDRKQKFAKIHPMEVQKKQHRKILRKGTINNFRIKKKESKARHFNRFHVRYDKYKIIEENSLLHAIRDSSLSIPTRLMGIKYTTDQR